MINKQRNQKYRTIGVTKFCFLWQSYLINFAQIRTFDLFFNTAYCFIIKTGSYTRQEKIELQEKWAVWVTSPFRLHPFPFPCHFLSQLLLTPPLHVTYFLKDPHKALVPFSIYICFIEWFFSFVFSKGIEC